MLRPLFAVESDVDVDAIERAHDPDRVRAVLQHARRPRRVRRGSKDPEEVGDLFVLKLAALQRLLAPELRLGETGAQQIDRVHGARIVDVVGRDERRVHRAGRIGMDHLVEKVLHVRGVDEDAVHPQVLAADGRIEIGPLRVGRVGRRVDGARADVAEPTRHADPIGANQFRIVIIVRIGVVALRIPLVLGGLVEVRIGKQA